MVRVGSMTYFQDHKWYDELADGKLKDETLVLKAKIEGSWGDTTPRVVKFCKWLKGCFENFHELEYEVLHISQPESFIDDDRQAMSTSKRPLNGVNQAPRAMVYVDDIIFGSTNQIPDAFLTDKICATDDFKEYEKVVKGEKDKESYASKFDASMLHDDVDDFENRIEPGSHKEHPEHVVDDDENEEEKKDDKMGSLENRTEKMQIPIPTPPRSPRINLSSDKIIVQELTDTDMERKCVTLDEFWKVHGKVDQVLLEIIPQLTEKSTNDLIEGNVKRAMVDTVIQERDAFQSKLPTLFFQ
ncbi:hypothetical protein Tco_1344261 [Tanacetum coccineum]